MKLKAIEEELYKDSILGKCIVHLKVIEFQKRGPPNAHILIILHEKDRIKTVEQVDEIVSAQILPHPNIIFDQNEENQKKKRGEAKWLRELMLKNTVHGLCAKKKPNDPCMYIADGGLTQVCSKKFPREFRKRNTL